MLAERVREVLAAEPDVTERKMFGGLAFLAEQRLVVVASHEGGLLCKAPKAEHEALLAKGAEPFEMGGRTMQGWLRVDTERLRTRRQLATWVERSLALARAMPKRR